MAQYKHDRFFKFYIRSLYRSKGDTLKNIQIHNDEDLEIDLMFVGDLSKSAWIGMKQFALTERKADFILSSATLRERIGESNWWEGNITI